MEDVIPPRLLGALELADGRKLGVAEYGPADGRAILWFHGTPGGRRQLPPLARELADDEGLRFVMIERPGIGVSTSYRYEAIIDWAGDVEQVVSALGIERFGVVGLSGGGPYALACSYAFGDRVAATVTLGGVAPSHGEDAPPGGFVNRMTPVAPVVALVRRPLERTLWATIQMVRPFREQAMSAFASLMPPGDQAVFARPEMRKMFFDDLLDGMRRQMDAPLLDFLLFARPWGFALADVKDPVLVVHGDTDIIVPLSHAEYMAERLPNAELLIRHAESHLGGLDLAREIVDFIVERW